MVKSVMIALEGEVTFQYCVEGDFVHANAHEAIAAITRTLASIVFYTNKTTQLTNIATQTARIQSTSRGVRWVGRPAHKPQCTHIQHHSRLLYNGVSAGNDIAAGAQHGPTCTSRDRSCPGYNTRGAYG